MSAFLLAFLPTNMSLKTLLKKCTTPVRAIANSTGKNKANTGNRIVPKPKPEKKVKIEARKATKQIMIYSMSTKIVFSINLNFKLFLI